MTRPAPTAEMRTTLNASPAEHVFAEHVHRQDHRGRARLPCSINSVSKAQASESRPLLHAVNAGRTTMRFSMMHNSQISATPNACTRSPSACTFSKREECTEVFAITGLPSIKTGSKVHLRTFLSTSALIAGASLFFQRVIENVPISGDLHVSDGFEFEYRRTFSRKRQRSGEGEYRDCRKQKFARLHARLLAD